MTKQKYPLQKFVEDNEEQLEKQIDLCRLFYRVVKSSYPRIPKYRKSWIRIYKGQKDCGLNSLWLLRGQKADRLNAKAHTHTLGKGKICFNPKFLMGRENYQLSLGAYQGSARPDESLAQQIANTMAHEIAHLMTKKRKRHTSNTFKSNNEKFNKVLTDFVNENVDGISFYEPCGIEDCDDLQCDKE